MAPFILNKYTGWGKTDLAFILNEYKKEYNHIGKKYFEKYIKIVLF